MGSRLLCVSQSDGDRSKVCLEWRLGSSFVKIIFHFKIFSLFSKCPKKRTLVFIRSISSPCISSPSLKRAKSLKTNQKSVDTNSHNALPPATTLCTPHDRHFCILYSALKHQICSLPLLTNIPFNFDKYPLLISAMLRIEVNNWELLFWWLHDSDSNELSLLWKVCSQLGFNSQVVSGVSALSC